MSISLPGAGRYVRGLLSNQTIVEQDKFSVRARLKSFTFAFAGLKSLLKNEHNSRIHVFAALLSLAVGAILKISFPEWCLIIIVIGIVFIAELLNSSVESLADLVNREQDEAIKRIKDYTAASVLVSAIISVLVGGIIFIPKIIALLQR
jgi:diacylglycerol kinase